MNEIKVWDPAVRIFHWSLVIAFTIAYITGEDNELLHANAGYVVSGLIVFRLIWGFTGTKYARFRNFIYKPASIIRYLQELKQGHPSRYLGHNPAGGFMVMLLLVSLILSCWTGIVAYGQEGHGPLAATDLPVLASAVADSGNEHNEGKDNEHEFMEELHEFLSNFTLFLVLLHIVGVIISSILHRENLVKAMFTGRKLANREHVE